MLYKIRRYFSDMNRKPVTIKTGLYLEEAQEHCRDPETSSRTCTDKRKLRYYERRGVGAWFDGYTEDN